MKAPTTQPTQPRAGLIDPRALSRISSLQLRARAIVEGFMSGLHRSPYHGFSVEFTEYRPYVVGDDMRYLDWRLYARSDRLYVKKFEEETNLRCWLLVDHSRSMDFGTVSGVGTSVPTLGELKPNGDLWKKSDYAATLAATLAYFLSTQRDAAGLVTFDDELREYLPARYRPGHLRRLMVALERTPTGTGTKLTEPLRRIADLVTKRGIHVLISDLLAPLDGLETHLGYLRSRGHEVVIFHVLDPAELKFNFDEASLFFDVETGKELYIDPDAIRRNYMERMNEHLSRIEKICEGLGVDYHRVTTDQPLEHALFDFLAARQLIKRTAMRRGQRGTGGGGGGGIESSGASRVGRSSSPPSQGGVRGGSGARPPIVSVSTIAPPATARTTLPQPLPAREGSRANASRPTSPPSRDRRPA